MPKSILLFSGGLDSTTLLWKLKPDVKCLLFDYGQRHRRELHNAEAICRAYDIEHVRVNLEGIQGLIAKGSQTGADEVPEGHYAAPSMKTTVVPNRNMIMLSIAVGHAIATETHNVFTAVHAGDHAIYPDCRPQFYTPLRQAVWKGNYFRVQIRTPFIKKTKAQIVRLGIRLGVPYALTWSCYKGEEFHCGVCGTCVERKEAFKLAGVEDPTLYASN